MNLLQNDSFKNQASLWFSQKWGVTEMPKTFVMNPEIGYRCMFMANYNNEELIGHGSKVHDGGFMIKTNSGKNVMWGWYVIEYPQRQRRIIHYRSRTPTDFPNGDGTSLIDYDIFEFDSRGNVITSGTAGGRHLLKDCSLDDSLNCKIDIRNILTLESTKSISFLIC